MLRPSFDHLFGVFPGEINLTNAWANKQRNIINHSPGILPLTVE